MHQRPQQKKNIDKNEYSDKNDFNKITVFPALVTQNAQIKITASNAEKMIVQITNAAGVGVKQFGVSVNKGDNVFDINIMHFLPGLYHVSAATVKGKIIAVNFMKQ